MRTIANIYNTILRQNEVCFECPFHASARLRFVPAGALEPGPQFGRGFCWYRTSFTEDDFVVAPGWCLKLASNVGSFSSSAREGEVCEILSILTGFFLIHDRKML